MQTPQNDIWWKIESVAARVARGKYKGAKQKQRKRWLGNAKVHASALTLRFSCQS